MLLFITLVWLILGYAVARYFLQQHTWLMLIPLSLGLGITLQTLMLNLFLYPFDALTGYWVSVIISGVISAILFIWKRTTVRPLTLGTSPRTFGLTSVLILFIWAWTLPAFFRFDYFDHHWHYPLAGNIASGGLPVRLYSNPSYCTYYHYAFSLLGGVIFRVSGTSMAIAFDWVDSVAVLAFLGLSVQVVRNINQHRSLMVGVLGMALLLLYGHAGWLELIFYNESIRSWTNDIPLFEYFQIRAENRTAYVGNGGFPFSFGSFAQTNAIYIHTHSINIGLVCAMLALLLILDKKPGMVGSGPNMIITGLILGLMPLASETLWPVPMAAIGLYGLYLLYKEPENRRHLIAHGMVIFIPALILAVFQGGTVTDTFFCQEKDLGTTAEGKQLEAINFLAGPGYYSWQIQENEDYVNLNNPENWLRALGEFGIVVLLYPFLIYHYAIRRKHPFATTIVIATLLSMIGILITDFEAIAVNSSRIGSVALTLTAMMTADWLRWQWKWKRKILVVVLIVGMIFDGLFALFGQAVYKPSSQNALDFEHILPVTNIDEKVQEKWFGQFGKPEKLILDLFSNRFSYIRPGWLFGNYTLFASSRSQLGPVSYITALREYPDPRFLHLLDIEYVYLDEVWWTKASPEAIALLENPTYFEEIFTESKGNEFRKLYRVVFSDSTIEPIEVDEATLIPAHYFLAIFRWSEAIPTGTDVFHPAFHLDPVIRKYLPKLQLQSDLDESSQIAIDRWRETKLPNDLREAGFQYIFLDSLWFTFASEDDINVIEDSYILVLELKISQTEEFVRIYQIPE